MIRTNQSEITDFNIYTIPELFLKRAYDSLKNGLTQYEGTVFYEINRSGDVIIKYCNLSYDSSRCNLNNHLSLINLGIISEEDADLFVKTSASNALREINRELMLTSIIPFEIDVNVGVLSGRTAITMTVNFLSAKI